jgi:hypothetical protein
MRKRTLSLVAAAATGTVSMMSIGASAQVLYNPVVDLIGDGTTTVTGTGYTAADESYYAFISNQTSPVSSNNYTGTASGLVTENSTASGELTNNQEVANAAAAGTQYLGTDYVFNGGYAGTDGTAAVTTGNAAREVGYMTATGLALTSSTIGASQPGTSLAAGSDLRGVVGIVAAGGSSFWSAGTSSTASTAGYQYVNTPVQLAATPTNVRTVQIRNGQLYGSSSTGSVFEGIAAIGTGTPTTGGQTVLPLVTIGTSTTNSAYAFSLLDDSLNTNGTAAGVAGSFAAAPYNVAYIADAGNASAAAGGIEKWVYEGSPTAGNNGGWVKVYTLLVTDGTTADTGNFGLAAQLDPTTKNVYLWTTTNDGTELQQFTDPLDATLAATATTTDASEITLATAPTNDLFRGVALAVPEPTSAGLIVLGGLGLMARRRTKAT